MPKPDAEKSILKNLDFEWQTVVIDVMKKLIPALETITYGIGRFQIFDHRDFLLLKVFYSSDRTCQDEQKNSYNLPSKVPLEFSRNS